MLIHVHTSLHVPCILYIYVSMSIVPGNVVIFWSDRRKVQQFPVKLTEPLTAILYITADKVHMEDLKHVLHLQSIKEGR